MRFYSLGILSKMQQVEQDISASMRNYTYLFDLEQVRVDLGDDLELVRVCALLCDGATQSKLCNYLARAWLRNETELQQLGWDELVATSPVLLVEWPDRAAGTLPPDVIAAQAAIQPQSFVGGKPICCCCLVGEPLDSG